MTVHQLKFFKLHSTVVTPEKATTGSACWDLSYWHDPNKSMVSGYNEQNAPVDRHYDSNGVFSIMPGDRLYVPTGLILDIPVNHSVRVFARSGLSSKMGLGLINSVGIIDSDYIDPVYVLLCNFSKNKVNVTPNTRIAQMELIPTIQTHLTEINERPEQKTNRTGGFGSTG